MSEELVCFNVTEHTPNTRFLVSLSDGRTIIEDRRPNMDRPWIRVKQFLKESGLNITELRVQSVNSKYIHSTPANQQGYFYMRRAEAMYPPGMSVIFSVIGYYDGKKVHSKAYVEPYLNKMQSRPPRDVDSCCEGLFINE